MAQFRAKSLFYNFILLVVLLPALLLSLPGLSLAASLALEQEARCGMEEHVHTQDCYLGDVLLCTKKMHTHSNNCYLVLLSDNDINQLLSAVSSTPDKSLESIITAALAEEDDDSDSLQFQPPEQDPSAVPLPSVSSPTAAPLVLNGKLTTTETLAAGPSDVAPIGDNGIALAAVTPSTGDNAVNFYVRLDGTITCIGTGTLTVTGVNRKTYSYSAQNTVNTYNGNSVVSSLATNNIHANNGYYFRYNINGNTSAANNFNTNAEYQNQNLRFGNNAGARNVLLTTRSGRMNNYTYTPVDFYTVTLDYSEAGGTDQVQYVQSGLKYNLPDNHDEYNWFDEDGNPVTNLPDTITGKTTLYARPKTITATFVDRTGKPIADPISGTPSGGGLSITLPALPNHPNHCWIEQNGDGTTHSPNKTLTINKNTTFVAVPTHYTLTFLDANGTTTTQTVPYRETITLPDLPAGYNWYLNDKPYSPGASFGPVTDDASFTAAPRSITVNYNVNFPSDAVSYVDSVPTLYGTTSATGKDTTLGGQSYITRSLTSRKARREVNSGNKESQTYYFRGWTIAGTDLLIPPDATLTWSLLESYAVNDTVNLTGVWTDVDNATSATFFVRYDSVAVDTNGNITNQDSNLYTPELFHTYVGGIPSNIINSDSQLGAAYNIADTSSDNSFGADQAIRALYGEKADGIWLYDFPNDDDVFAWLKDHMSKTPGKTLSVDGEEVKLDELDSAHYAIRWYVFKIQNQSWHIDGKLVKKEGTITVDKVFGGESDTIAKAKDGFYIVAENGTKDANGNFVPYEPTDKAYKRHVLQLKDATVNGNSYEWRIDHVLLDEYWRITEYPVAVEGSSYYAEYSVYDTDGSYTAMAEYGTQASAVGKTFALDEDPDQGLLVDFRNYYYDAESILIKKEDAATGLPIGGADFELWQNDTQLTFDYDTVSGQYVRNETGNGALKRITTESDGFSIISTTGFSYEYGNVVVKEVIAPAGYAAAPDVTIGLDSDGKTVVLKNVANTEQPKWKDFAEVPNNDVLVVKDNTADYIAVNVKKLWNTNTPADSVDVVLQANGGNAAAVFPGLGNAQVKLNESNNWSYTWTDLPRYANGLEVTWSVKEVVVGNTPTMSDGVTFANWIVTYSPGTKADLDADGKSDDYAFTVTNTSRSPKLILTKVSTNGSVLPGATFRLEQVELKNGAWQTVSGSTPVTATTDATGMITFDNLVAGAFYRLTETGVPPEHYSLFEPVVLTVNGVGEISQVDTSGKQSPVTAPGITTTSAYNIQVVNHRSVSLPETGGPGRAPCAISGTLLMAAALLLLYRSRYGKEEKSSS